MKVKEAKEEDAAQEAQEAACTIPDEAAYSDDRQVTTDEMVGTKECMRYSDEQNEIGNQEK